MFGFDSLITIGGPGLFILLIWTLAWTGWALWVAAKEGSKPWFIALLILNTAGILEILYIFVFSKKGKKDSSKEKVKRGIEKTKDTIEEKIEDVKDKAEDIKESIEDSTSKDSDSSEEENK